MVAEQSGKGLSGVAIRTFRDLLVWQKSMNLVTSIYKVSQSFPREERYGITAQLRRSAVSVPSSIAEGYGRHSTRDYIRYLQIASGSLFELQTQVEISLNLKYLSSSDFKVLNEMSCEIERMLSSLINKLRAKVAK